MTDWAVYQNADDERIVMDERAMLWLARALVGECGENPSDHACLSVAWTLATRYLLWPGTRPWTSFVSFMRAFSQPINPVWCDEKSAVCRANPEACTEAHIARRKRISRLSWDEIPEPVSRNARAFAQTSTRNPVYGAVDFADDELVDRQGKVGVTVGGNAFIWPEYSGMKGWKHGGVWVSLEPQESRLIAALVGVTIAAMAGTIGYGITRLFS